MTDKTESRRKSLTPGAVPVLVTAALVAAVIASFLVLRSTVQSQERNLLQERADEVTLVLEGALRTIEAQLNRIGAVARYGSPGPQTAGREAKAIIESPGAPNRTVAVMRKQGDKFIVTAAAGPDAQVGDQFDSKTARAASAAIKNPGLQSAGVVQRRGAKLLRIGLGPPATPERHVAVLLTRVNPDQVTNQGADSPFSDLDIVLYASPRADRKQLLLKTTKNLPLEGDVAQTRVKVGEVDWLIQTATRQPLTGGLAMASPWILLGIGLFASALTGGFLEYMQRRRDYALSMVDERTAELQDSLRQLGEAQQSLVMQQRLAAVGQVAAAVGHELRNPLGVMTNALYLARAQLSGDDSDKIGRHLDTTEREIAAATVIVESLLGFTRAKSPEKAPVDFESLFNEALTVTPAPVGIEVVQVGLDTLPLVSADRQQLRQVVLNLLTNSYQAMEGKGVLTVAGRAKAHEIELTFADTGPGLDQETAAQIFEPFFTRKASGIGLGLAVTQQIVEAHGGNIKVKSSPGEGATFVICLPNVVPVKAGA